MGVKPGRLLVFEGVDGSGKSTQQRRLADVLRSAGWGVVETREPSDGEAGQRIRAMARSGEPWAPREELRCFIADREEHVANVVAPALAGGQLVLCDRYTLSSVAYQGARGLDAAEILADSEQRFPIPDLVFLIELDPEAALARVGTRTSVAEPTFERLDLQLAVARQYAAIDRPYIERIDGAAPPDEVHQRVLEALRRRLDLL